MSESKQNDQGRYFEYLVTKRLESDLRCSLTKRAIEDQNRDKVKEIKRDVIHDMSNATSKISKWISTHIKPGNTTILDRHPDKEKGKKTHEDISISDGTKRIAFSLKHNHTAIFHGRILSAKNWLGLKDNDTNLKKLDEINKRKISELQKIIPINTKFADKGIKPEYQEVWSDFICEIHQNARNFLLFSNKDKLLLKHLFDTILGHGLKQYRIIKKGSSVIVQDLSNVSYPSSVKIENKQIPSNDQRSKYVWHLIFNFNNGMKIGCRTKQDSGTMSSTPKIKGDWQILDFGKSGIKEFELK